MSDLRKYSLDILKLLIMQPDKPITIEEIALRLFGVKKQTEDTEIVILNLKKYSYYCPNCKNEVYLDSKLSIKKPKEPCGQTKQNGNRCGALRKFFKSKGIKEVQDSKSKNSIISNLKEREVKQLLELGFIQGGKSGYSISMNKRHFKQIAKLFHESGKRKEFLLSAYGRECLNKHILSLIRDRVDLMDDYFKDEQETTLSERDVKEFIAYILSSPTAFELFIVNKKREATDPQEGMNLKGVHKLLDNCVSIDVLGKKDFIHHVKAIEMVFGQYRIGYD